MFLRAATDDWISLCTRPDVNIWNINVGCFLNLSSFYKSDEGPPQAVLKPLGGTRAGTRAVLTIAIIVTTTGSCSTTLKGERDRKFDYSCNFSSYNFAMCAKLHFYYLLSVGSRVK